jgi:hypothetical protein
MNYPKAPRLENPTEQPSPLLNRRTILKAGGVGIAGALIAGSKANTELTNSLWHDTRTSLKIFETGGQANGECWIVVPGLGVQSGEGIMKALHPSLEMGQYAGYVSYADTGIELDTIAESINRAQHKLGFCSVNFYLHSMGGAMIPAILSRLDAAIAVGTLGYNCTPWTKQYTSDEHLIDLIASLPVEGSYATKLASQLVDRFCRPQIEDLSFTEKLGVVMSMTNDRSSPKTWLQQIRYLSTASLSDYDIIPESIRSIYLTPSDPSTDPVVRVPEAIATFRATIPGIKSVVRVGSEGHANPRQYPTEYNRALAPFTTPIYDTEFALRHNHHRFEELESRP